MKTETYRCVGFKAGGIEAGIKKRGGKDLGLIYSEFPATVAGVFTQNIVKAAPVIVSQQRIQSGSCRAIIVNSGNANCCTGDQGITDAKETTKLVASELHIDEHQVLVASTGVIGNPMPMEKIRSSIPTLIQSISADGFSDFAESIMTTDTVPKIVYRKKEFNGHPFSVIGIAKGSGMICPNMATMLCFVCTDIGAHPDFLKKALKDATDQSFNRITVDGDTSTNDVIFLMANGASGITILDNAQQMVFQSILNDVLLSLAKMVVKDGEGATKFVEVIVKNAMSNDDARKIAQTIANSNLVKTALFGQDANWGRILAAAGRAGVSMDPDKTDIFFDTVQMVKNGMGCGQAAEFEATQVLKKPEFSITLDCHIGNGSASVFTCDFSINYVKINADYRS